MPSPQKAKGSSFEREVAKFLTETYGETFIRAPGSGAYVGGTNSSRKEFLHEGQIRSFKGDIVPGQSFPKLNAECKSYKEFPFHLLLSGECKVIEQWIEQLLEASDPDDFNILFMKFNRIGRYVAVQPKLTWIIDNFNFYASKKHGDWYITEFDRFFELNKDLVKQYSGPSSGINLSPSSGTITILTDTEPLKV